MVASVRRANSMWGAAMGVALALLFSSAVAPLTPGCAAASAVPSGWRAWTLGDLQLAAPGAWRSMESSGPAPLSFRGDAWNFTLAENPRNVDAGALLSLAWTEDGSIYSAGVEPSEIIGSREVDFAGLPADRVEFAVRDAFNNTAGFDIVPQSPIAGRRLTLTCRAPQAKWPAVKPICEGIVASLALALPADAPPDSSSTVATPTPESTAAEPDSQPSVGSEEAPSTPIRRAEAQNTDAVVNGPKVATAFTVKRPIFLRALSTYHWNDGRGAAPGTMSLIDANGTKFGPWQARGESGQGGAPNVTWAAEIRQRMEPGRYTLSTSSDQTWSTNEKAGWKGFYALEYQTYPEVAQPTPQPTATVATTSTPTAEAGSQKLFSGSLDAWLPLETDGGNFKSFARLENGALIVDVPVNSNWGKTGIRSKEPLVRFNRNEPAAADLTFRLDPRRTTAFVVDVGVSDTAQEWSGHEARVGWILADDGGSATLSLWLRGALAMKATLGPQAPETLTLNIAPDGVVSVIAPDGQRLEGIIPAEAIDAGLRVYALAHAPAPNKPAQMALLGISLKRTPWAAKDEPIGVARNEILFDGALGTRFVAHSASGGNFVEHARLDRDGLMVDVPKDSNWGKVGVRTPEPAFWLDRWGEGASVDLVYRFDPARTTGFVIVLSAPAAAPGADPDYPALVLHWRRNAEGGGARAAFYLFDQPREPVWDVQLLEPAPAELCISLRPEGVQVLGEGLPATIAPWTALREGLGFRAWVYAQPDRAGLPVKMALRSIALAQRLGDPPVAAAPAPGVAKLPVKTLFDGRNAPAWEPIGVAGGDFARFAKWGDGRLIVQTQEKASWAKTGLLSAAPVAPLDARLYQTPYRLTVQVDPKETSGFAVAIGPSKAPDMWPTDRLWTSLIRGVDGRWILSIDRGGNRRWSRVVPRAFVEAEWDGRVVFDLHRNWTTVRLGEDGPLLSASTGFEVGQNLFMSIVSHPPLENLAARLTLEAVSGGWATPGGMTAAQRWPLLDDDAFDPAAFLNELAAGATRETPADAAAAKISGADAAGYLDAPTLRVAPSPAPTPSPQKSGSLLEWLSPIGAAYAQTAAPDCAKAIADQVDAARHIQITLGEQADLKGKLADLGLTLLGKTKFEEGTWREAIRSAADRSVNAWQDGQAIGEDWNQDHTQDMVIHFMQAAMKIGVSSGELGDDSVAREVQGKLRQAWVNAVQKMPEPQARELIAQLSATMKTHSSQDLYKELLDKGKDIDFGAAFGQGAEGENKAMLWTLTNTTLASFIPEYAIGREVASLAVESGKAAQNFVVNQQVQSMYAIWKDQIVKNGGQGANDFETALTIQGYSSVLQTAKPLIRAAKGLKDDQGISDDQAKTYLFGLFEKWRQADDTAGKQADGLSKASAAFAKTTCRAELESEVSPKGAACEKELQLFKRYADLDAQVRGRVNAWMRPGNSCNAPAAIDSQTGALVCQLLRYGEDAYKTSLGKYLEGCGLLDYAKDRNNAAKRVLDRLPQLTMSKLKALFDRAGVKPTDAFYGCLCPNGFHLYNGPDGRPCRRIGPLGGVSFAGYDPGAWAACAAANRLPDGRTVVDAVADTLTGIHIDQK
jgi:hypothetical protein